MLNSEDSLANMKSFLRRKSLLLSGLIVSVATTAIDAAPKKFDEVNKGYTRVVSTINGQSPLFDLWANCTPEASMTVP